MTFAGGNIFLSMYCNNGDDVCGNFNMSWLFGRVNCLIKNGVLDPAASFLRGWDVIYNGVTYGPNEWIKDGGVTQGAFTNYITASTNLLDASWSLRGTAYVAVDGQTVTVSDGDNDILAVTGILTPDTQIGVSILLSNPLSQTGVAVFRSPQGSLFGRWLVDLSLVSSSLEWISPSHPSVTVINPFKTNLSGGAGMLMASNLGVLTFRVHDMVLCESRYSINPIQIPTAGAPASIDTAAASATPGDLHGATVDLSLLRFKWLKDLVDGVGVDPAVGTLTYTGHVVVPTLAQWQSTGDLELIMADDGATVEKVFYIDSSDGLYKLTDGVNTAVSPAPYVAGQAHKIEICLNATEMWLKLDGVFGVKVPFTGTLVNGASVLKFNAHEDIVRSPYICGSPTVDTIAYVTVQGVQLTVQGVPVVVTI